MNFEISEEIINLCPDIQSVHTIQKVYTVM
mgnify:CR=1 FL=1